MAKQDEPMSLIELAYKLAGVRFPDPDEIFNLSTRPKVHTELNLIVEGVRAGEIKTVDLPELDAASDEALAREILGSLYIEESMRDANWLSRIGVSKATADRLIGARGNAVIGAEGIDQQSEATSVWVIHRSGKGWEIGPKADPIFIRTLKEKGFRLLQELVRHPGKVFTALELEIAVYGAPSAVPHADNVLVEDGLSIVSGGSGSKPTDAEKQTKRECRGRLIDIAEELKDVPSKEDRSIDDDIFAEPLEKESDEILDYLLTLNRYGATRDNASPGERARNRVRTNIGGAMDDIERDAPDVYKLLAAGLNQGSSITFNPDASGLIWET